MSCTGRGFFFGSDGCRYMCIKKMGLGVDPREHISQSDGGDWLEDLDCRHFGSCTGCDNNIEGEVIVND